MPIVLCNRCGYYGDNSKHVYCEVCGLQLPHCEYSSEDASDGHFANEKDKKEEEQNEHRI